MVKTTGDAEDGRVGSSRREGPLAASESSVRGGDGDEMETEQERFCRNLGPFSPTPRLQSCLV